MSNVTGTIPSNPHVQKWVKEVAALCQPDECFWCDGSEDERERLTEIAIQMRGSDTAESKKVTGLLFASQRAQRCRAHGEPNLRLHGPARRCGP